MPREGYADSGRRRRPHAPPLEPSPESARDPRAIELTGGGLVARVLAAARAWRGGTPTGWSIPRRAGDPDVCRPSQRARPRGDAGRSVPRQGQGRMAWAPRRPDRLVPGIPRAPAVDRPLAPRRAARRRRPERDGLAIGGQRGGGARALRPEVLSRPALREPL